MTKFIYTSKIHWNKSINFLINGEEKVGIENLNNPKEFIDYSLTIDDVYEKIKEYNPTKKRRVLIAFDDMIANMNLIKN